MRTVRTMRPISDDERRARLGLRHHLARTSRASSSVDAARTLVALHGTDPSSVFLAALARAHGNPIGDTETALYDERALIRILGMRRTVWVVPNESLPLILASSTRKIAPTERKKLVQHIELGGVAKDGARWLKKTEDETLAALRARGTATAIELAEDVPALRTTLKLATGKPYETEQRLTSRVLSVLATDARIVRGRPNGSWTSSQYRWAPVEQWFPEGIDDLSTEHAQETLLRYWLATFGPATHADMAWWTGWTMGDVKRALAAIKPVEVKLDDGSIGLVLADDEAPVKSPDPWVALLPSLDPTAMGWMGRDWYLGAHRASLFDYSGNIGPTVWSDGKIVGGWAQIESGEVVFELLEDVGTSTKKAIEKAASTLTQALGDVRVKARFPTPLEKRLYAQNAGAPKTPKSAKTTKTSKPTQAITETKTTRATTKRTAAKSSAVQRQKSS